MEIAFKYKGKLIVSPNLEKKLKQMKISLEDIEIVEVPKKKQESGLDPFYDNKQMVIVRSTEDDIKRVCFIPKDKMRPTIRQLFKHQMWNPITKTGIRYLTEEFLLTMYYEN